MVQQFSLAELREGAVGRRLTGLVKAIDAYSARECKYYLDRTKVVFTAKYADNASNRRIGREGNSFGNREGSRNPKYIPANLAPINPLSAPPQITPYYDFRRNNWRSFRNTAFTRIYGVWDDERKLFTLKPDEVEAFAETYAKDISQKKITAGEAASQKLINSFIARKEARSLTQKELAERRIKREERLLNRKTRS